MKHLLIISFLTLQFFSDCNAQKTTETSQENLKTEAKNFSLSIVESYFDTDCEKVYVAISDTLLLIGRETVLIKGESKVVVKEIGTDISRHLNQENICLAVKKAIKDKTKTYNDYLNTYDPLLFTRAELEDLLSNKGKRLPDKFITIPNDLFFLGMKLKDKLDASKNFIWDDMFLFMVRKEKETWKIKALSD